MEPNSNASTTKPADQLTTTEPATQSKSNKPLLAITIVTSVLALVGIGFGVYGMLQDNNRNCPNTSNDTVCPTTDSSSQQKPTTQTAPSTAEITKLLEDKYGLKPVTNTFGDTLVGYLDDFDESAKIVQTIYAANSILSEAQYPSEAPMYIRTVSYDVFNNAYKQYFAGEDLKKQDYDLKAIGVTKIVYLPEEDKYEIYYRDGLGGYSFVDKIVKVMDTAGTENGFVATVATATIDTQVKQDASMSVSKVGYGDGSEYYYILIPNEDMSEIYDSVSLYDFSFVNENGEYKLASIQKK